MFLTRQGDHSIAVVGEKIYCCKRSQLEYQQRPRKLYLLIVRNYGYVYTHSKQSQPVPLCLFD